MMASLRLVWRLRSRGAATVCKVRALSAANATRFADAGAGSGDNKARGGADNSNASSGPTASSASSAASSSSSSSSSSYSSPSFLDAVLSKARKQRAEDQQRQQPQQSQKRVTGRHDEDELDLMGSAGLTSGGKHRRRRRRRVTAAEREKRTPTFDFISDPETRKLVRDAYKYGPPAMSRLKWSLTPERCEGLARDLQPDNFFRDMANEFPEILDMLSESQAGAEDAHGIPQMAGDAAQQPGLTAIKVVESKDSDAHFVQDVPPAVADILSRSVEIDTTHKASEWFSSTTPETCTSASTYHDPTESSSRASFPGKEENDNELAAFDLGLDVPHLTLEERMRLHTDFSKELEEFKDAAPNVKYFAELCATSLSNNPFITAKQKHAFFYNLRTLAEGDFDPLSDEEDVQLWPEGFSVPNADPKV